MLWLEQSRATNPSGQVVSALARAAALPCRTRPALPCCGSARAP
nr:hypothetical protein [Kibdelosporangium sp. MJ126-NF4]